jgi:hypothetical protein
LSLSSMPPLARTSPFPLNASELIIPAWSASVAISWPEPYRCDACLPLAQLQAAAAARIAWSTPLSQSSDHPPATSPYA